ncbi:cupin [Phyllobacterium sp. SYP-B3895]|uniref:cupin domain-containing protein n=1 Tax=Phyllobacterium sp. SYP-B3895 TaxID=2663240 RepID=UPI0012998E1A|nr:cupin domain-containing protein [Phyllobacterium sp. SYP-B3895]MRG55148.1 cupin [Phyllobacterium sp. SYP-B3895]
MTLTPEAIRSYLGLSPHPEGGSYVQTFRDNNEWPVGGRGHSTAIYFLLEKGEVSAWHRVKDAAEVWHWYGGAPLSLAIASADGARETHRLGLDLAAGERPQAVVPAGQWQSAQTTGEWTLVGCTVAPGFDFAQFELAEPGWEP